MQKKKNILPLAPYVTVTVEPPRVAGVAINRDAVVRSEGWKFVPVIVIFGVAGTEVA